MKVLITGAAGFIGSHLTERLVRNGAAVTAFIRYNSRADDGLLKLLPADVRKNIRIISGDLRDSDAVQRAVNGQQVVFHLAALIGIPYSYVHPLDYVQTNVRRHHQRPARVPNRQCRAARSHLDQRNLWHSAVRAH